MENTGLYSQYGMCLRLVVHREAYAGGGRKREHVGSKGQHLPLQFKLELKLDSETAISLPSEKSNFRVVEKDPGDSRESRTGKTSLWPPLLST